MSRFLKTILVQGGDVKFALVSNLPNFLTNLNFSAKITKNMQLKVLNNFHRKLMSKIQPPKTQDAKKRSFVDLRILVYFRMMLAYRQLTLECQIAQVAKQPKSYQILWFFYKRVNFGILSWLDYYITYPQASKSAFCNSFQLLLSLVKPCFRHPGRNANLLLFAFLISCVFWGQIFAILFYKSCLKHSGACSFNFLR